MMVRVVVIMSTYVDIYPKSNSNADIARSHSLLTRYIIQDRPMSIHPITKHAQKLS
jgi:hypothetical protein